MILKRIMFLLALMILIYPPAKSQKRKKKSSSYSYAFTMNTVVRASPELSLQFERRFNTKYSILGSVGLKRHKLPGYFGVSEHTNAYVFQKTERITWILFIPIPGNIGEYLDGTQPLDTLGHFAPATSIPVKLGGRKYFGNPNRSIGIFLGVGVLANFHKGYSINDETFLLAEEQYETSSGVPLIAGETATVTIFNYEQTRSMAPANMVTVGLLFSAGIRWRLMDHFSLLVEFESGGNLINSNQYWQYYGIQPAFLNAQLGVSYSF